MSRFEELLRNDISFKDMCNINEIYSKRLEKEHPLGLFREVVTDYFGISYEEFYNLFECEEDVWKSYV